MFTPTTDLEPGTWYWQIGITRHSKTVWSEVYEFEIPPRARRLTTPAAETVLREAAKQRPRLMPTSASVRAIRSSDSQALAQRLYRTTSHLIGQELPDDTAPPAQGDDEYKRMKFARWGSKRLAAQEVSAVEALLCAGLLSGDDRYAEEAIRRAVNVAAWDPDGFTNPVVSDFSDASAMRTMALVYDTCHDQLSGSDRRALAAAISKRCRRFFEGSVNDVEARLFGAHLWQHLLTEFFEASLSLLGDLPEAHAWCRYIYELWVARFPLIAGNDGGWANGPKYFGTNVETLILMNRYFDNLGATEFDRRPWFRNASKFLQCAWPPNAANDGFGDGTELERVPSANHIHWMRYLGHRFSDREALDYVEAWEASGATAPASPRLALDALFWKKPRTTRPVSGIRSHCFQDTGLIMARTTGCEGSNTLRVAFRSSPYGSFNHMHSCQNAFNLFYGGERLFANSGYYVAMADEHAKNWYRDTRGHNTIRLDGQSQTRSPEGYGWIPRYIDGDRVTYWAGDASNAYGDAGLTRYRRHIALLDPNIVVIYDDLEADHAAEWTWQLHAHLKLTYNRRQQTFKTSNAQGPGTLVFASSSAFDVVVGDAFDPPAVNWGGKTYRGEAVEAFPKRWHGSVVTRPIPSVRFLSIVTAGARQPAVRHLKDGSRRVGRWKIEAEMDADQPTRLLITSTQADTALAVNIPETSFRGRTLRARNAAVLVEGTSTKRSVDQLPAAAKALGGSS